MPLIRPVLLLAAVAAAVLAAGAAPASAAPPTCVTPPVKQLRTDTLATFVPDCGLGGGPSAWSAVYTITQQPARGSAQVVQGLAGSTLRYLPKEGFEGSDGFAYTATVNGETSQPVIQQITVAPGVNSAPSCGATSPVKVRAGGTRTLGFACSDPDGDPVTVSISTQPAHGQATLGPVTSSGRSVTVTMPGAHTGPDELRLRADDGRTHVITTVALDVIASSANTAPTCWLDGSSWPVVRDQTTWIRTLACQDAEGDDIAIEVVTPPSHGSAQDADAAPGSWLGRQIAYTPAAGYTGPDTFSVRGRDSRGGTSGAFEVAFTVTEPESPLRPVECLPPSTVTVRAGGSKRVGVNCIASGPAGYEVLTPPQHGTLKKDNGFVYTPKTGYTGPDSFTVRVLSASGAGPAVTVPLSVVAGWNEAPYCGVSLPGRGMYAWEAVVRRDTEAELAVTCSDADGDSVTAQVEDPDHGLIVDFAARAPGLWETFSAAGRYRPDHGFVGFDTIRVHGSDGRGGTTTGAAQVTVRGASYNTAPSMCATLGVFPFVMIAGTEAEFSEFCVDAEGDEISMDVVTAPQHVAFGNVRGDGRLPTTSSITAPAGFTGTDRFELNPVDDRGARGGLYGRSLRVIADPGPVDVDAGRGESVGALQEELPTPARPANVRLTTLNEGRIRITHRNGFAPEGWAALGLTFDITAPDAIPEAPMELRFRLDSSLRGPGEPVAAITVFRNGRPVADCTGDGATPDPCIAQRRELTGGDAEILVRTSRASAWSFGRAVATTPPPPSGGSGAQPRPTEPPAPPFGGQGGGELAPDPILQPPSVRVIRAPRLGVALASGMRVGVRSPFAGTARARLTLDARTAKRLRLSKRSAIVVATGSARTAAGKEATLRLRFTPAARKALRKSARVRFTLRVAVGDGPATTRPVTLKR